MSAGAAPGSLDPIAELPDTRRSDRTVGGRADRRARPSADAAGAPATETLPIPTSSAAIPTSSSGLWASPSGDRGDDTRHRDQQEGRSRPREWTVVMEPERRHVGRERRRRGSPIDGPTGSDHTRGVCPCAGQVTSRAVVAMPGSPATRPRSRPARGHLEARRRSGRGGNEACSHPDRGMSDRRRARRFGSSASRGTGGVGRPSGPSRRRRRWSSPAQARSGSPRGASGRRGGWGSPRTRAARPAAERAQRRGSPGPRR